MKSAPTAPELRLPRLFLVLALSSLLWAQNVSMAANPVKAKSEGAEGDVTEAPLEVKPRKNLDGGGKNKAARPDPAVAEARQLARLRERLDVPDDTEWALIVERVTKVEELRRNVGPGGAGPRAAAVSTDKPKRKPGGVSANPELDALRSAVGDQFPDAEIKARLARAHDAYLQRVAQLTQAQADLRAVLTVRQEAVAVMAGLLPP